MYTYVNVFEIINRNYETFLTKPNKYSIFDNGDIIPKNRKCEHTNEAQTRMVWAFSNFVRILRTTICKKSIITFWKFLDRNFDKTVYAILTNFWERNSLASVTIWQSSNIGCFFCCSFLEIIDGPGRMISKRLQMWKKEEKKSERVFKRYLCEI